MSAFERPSTAVERIGDGDALGAFLEALPVPAAVLDRERTAHVWNRAAERAFGWPAAEVLGTRLPLLRGASAAQLRALLQVAVREGSTMPLEVEGRLRSGDRALLRLSASALSSGGAARVLVTFENIAEAASLRRRLRRTQRHFRSAAISSPEAVLIVSDGVVVSANAASARMLGVPRDQIVGSTFADHVEGDAQAIARLGVQGPHAEGGAVDARLLRASGEPLDVEIVATPLRFRGRRSQRLLLRDATLRRRVEVELARSQERFRLLSESVRDHAVVTLDVDGRISSWNAGAERLFGYGAAQAVGADMALLFREEDVGGGRPQAEIRTTLEVGRFEAEEWRHRADGSDFWASVTLVPQFASEDRLAGFVTTIQDLTERRRVQEALRRTEEQLVHAQRLEAVGRLAGGVAHDFNNLLTAIRGYAQLLLDDLGDDPRAADVEEIRRAADRGTTLTRQLLAIGRRQVTQPRRLDLNSLVTEAQRMLRRIVGEHIQLVATLDPQLGSVHADAGQMEQVLMNLVVNARDAMPAGGRILVTTRNQPPTPEAPHGQVVLGVNDDGTGMDDETKGRIFEPFFTTKPPGMGTGLGLSTVSEIVQQSGGTIRVESAPGVGTTFEVVLPRLEPAPVEPATGPRPATVLVTLRDRMLRALAVATLERRGHVVLQAANPAEAMRVARRTGRVDLLVTDSAERGSGGLALADSLAGACGALRVLFVCDKADSVSAILPPSLSKSPTAVLQQPFTPARLSRRIRLLLDRSMAT